MENASGLSAADVALLNDRDGNCGDWGNGSFMWIFALLLLVFGCGGFGNMLGGCGGTSNGATKEDVYSGFNFNGVNNKLDNLTIGQSNLQQSLGRGICDATYETNMNIKDCCCNNQRAIDQVRYDMAVQNGELKSLIHAEGDANREMIMQSKIDTMQQQINQLQMDKVACGIPKLNPYAWGVTPLDACHPCGYCN